LLLALLFHSHFMLAKVPGFPSLGVGTKSSKTSEPKQQQQQQKPVVTITTTEDF
jgi:hypothetical protein